MSAIINVLEASSSLSTAFGNAPSTKKYWKCLAPAGTALPYLTYNWADSGDEAAAYESRDVADNLTPYIDDGEMAFIIRAVGKEAALALGRQVQAVLNDAPLAISDGTQLLFRRKRRRSQLDPDKGPGGVDVWQRILIFRSIVSRTQ